MGKRPASRLLFAASLALGLSALWPTAAAALGFIPTQDDRRVSNVFSDRPGTSDTPGAGELDWSGSVQLASQQSSIGTTSMSGTGAVSVFSDVEFGGGNSTFDVSFDVDMTTPVELDVLFTYTEIAFGTLTFEAALEKGATTLFRDSSDGTSFPIEDPPFSGEFRNELSFDGILDPGSYRLLVRIVPSGGNADGTFDFAFNAVPEPSTGLLLAAGLAAIAVRRRA